MLTGSPSVSEFFNLILIRFSRPQASRFNSLSLRPSVMVNFLIYLVYSRFFTLKVDSRYCYTENTLLLLIMALLARGNARVKTPPYDT